MNASAETGYPAPDGFAITWGFPVGAHDRPGELLEALPVGVDGVDVLGVSACLGPDPHAQQVCGPMLGAGRPPAGVAMVPVEHARFGPDPLPAPVILVGARRHAGSVSGWVEGLRLTYQLDGDWHTYVTTIPWSLELSTPVLGSPAPSRLETPVPAPPAMGAVWR